MTSTQNEIFEDALHTFLNQPRPNADEEVLTVSSNVEALIQSCAGHNDKWKRLLLAILHERYHLLSPEAKALRESEDHVSAGDGERKIFYLSIKTLFEQALQDGENEDVSSTAKGLEVMLDLLPYVGGSRDMCTVVETCLEKLITTGLADKRDAMMQLHGKESLGILTGYAVQHCTSMFSQGEVYALVERLIQVMADTLETDFDLVRSSKKNTQDGKPTAFPSTLHVFLPHRDRGRRKKKQKGNGTKEPTKVCDRQLVNAVAELLIWARVPAATSQEAFAQSYIRFVDEANKGDNERILKPLHTMQTIIRKLRKELNGYARSQGFMLSNQFDLDAEKLNMSKVSKGKAGDLSLLTKKATQKSSIDTLRLIHLRNMSNPSKITKFSSVGELLAAWDPELKLEVEMDYIQREIHMSRLKATILHLRKAASNKDRPVVVASMEMNESSNVAAVLMAAALGAWEIADADDEAMDTDDAPIVKLFIGGKEREVNSVTAVAAMIDQILIGLKTEGDAATFMDSSGVATTKAVLNLMDRHLGDNGTLLLISSAQVQLPEDASRDLTARGCRVHCHDADDIGDRLNREKAKRGDVTISLAWDTGDDLDLHVHLPSGEHLSFENTVSHCGQCCLDVDMNAGGPTSTEPVENIFCGNAKTKTEAPKGQYKVVVQNYSYHRTKPGEPIPWRVVVERNNEKERFYGECKGSGKKSDVVVCTFDYEGRKVPFYDSEEHDAFGKTNLVNITTSTGQTIEALSNLAGVLKQHEQLEQVRMLADDEVGEEDLSEEAPVARPTMAEEGHLEVTSRDRLDILLGKLPKRFHVGVSKAFGGASLVDECAKGLAKRMIADKIPLVELKRCGYPQDVIDAVKQNMAASSMMAVE